MNARQDKALYIRFMRGESMWEIAHEAWRRMDRFPAIELHIRRVEAAIRRHLIRKEGHAR